MLYDSLYAVCHDHKHRILLPAVLELSHVLKNYDSTSSQLLANDFNAVWMQSSVNVMTMYVSSPGLESISYICDLHDLESEQRNFF